MRKIPFVFEVRDLWPAVFVDLGVLTNPFVIRALESVEMFLYRRAALVVTVTEGFRTRLIGRGLPPQKVVTVTNGAAIESFTPGPRDNAVRAELGLAGKFVVGYIGAHGSALPERRGGACRNQADHRRHSGSGGRLARV